MYFNYTKYKLLSKKVFQTFFNYFAHESPKYRIQKYFLASN